MNRNRLSDDFLGNELFFFAESAEEQSSSFTITLSFLTECVGGK